MLLLLLLPVAVLLPPRSGAGRIIGGEEAEPLSRPYMAFLRMGTGGDAEGNCGGFLIREDVVLTAAHCNCNLGNITVLLGAHNVQKLTEKWRQEILVRRRIPHPEYNDETFVNDIMMLQLHYKAELTPAVKVIALPRRKIRKQDECSVAGWGKTSNEKNARMSPTLQEVELKIMENDMCQHSRYRNFNPSSMLCGGDPMEEKASFQGDSGGPLMCDGEAQGIVSYGRKDGSAPRVFTKVSKYVPWIKKMLRKLKP